MADVQPLVDAINALVVAQQTAEFSKHVKAPGLVTPDTTANELQNWQVRKFAEMNDAGQKTDEIVMAHLIDEGKEI